MDTRTIVTIFASYEKSYFFLSKELIVERLKKVVDIELAVSSKGYDLDEDNSESHWNKNYYEENKENDPIYQVVMAHKPYKGRDLIIKIREQFPEFNARYISVRPSMNLNESLDEGVNIDPDPYLYNISMSEYEDRCYGPWSELDSPRHVGETFMEVLLKNYYFDRITNSTKLSAFYNSMNEYPDKLSEAINVVGEKCLSFRERVDAGFLSYRKEEGIYPIELFSEHEKELMEWLARSVSMGSSFEENVLLVSLGYTGDIDHVKMFLEALDMKIFYTSIKSNSMTSYNYRDTRFFDINLFDYKREVDMFELRYLIRSGPRIICANGFYNGENSLKEDDLAKVRLLKNFYKSKLVNKGLLDKAKLRNTILHLGSKLKLLNFKGNSHKV